MSFRQLSAWWVPGKSFLATVQEAGIWKEAASIRSIATAPPAHETSLAAGLRYGPQDGHLTARRLNRSDDARIACGVRDIEALPVGEPLAGRVGLIAILIRIATRRA